MHLRKLAIDLLASIIVGAWLVGIAMLRPRRWPAAPEPARAPADAFVEQYLDEVVTVRPRTTYRTWRSPS